MVNNKINRFLSSLLVAIFFVPISVLAQHSVAGDLTSFANGFKSLFQGNVPGFVGGVVSALPLFGLIFVVYAISSYLALITLFRKNTDNDKKFAKIFGIGLALLGLAQQSIYNSVLGLSTAMLTIIFLLLAIFMTWIFWNTMRTSTNESSKEKYDSEIKAIKSEKDLDKEKDEHLHNKKEFAKTHRELDTLDERLDNVKNLTGTELEQIDELARMLTHVTSSAHDMKAVSKFGKQLSHGIAGLITTMNHTRGREAKVINALNVLRANIKHKTPTSGGDEKHKFDIIHKLCVERGITKNPTEINNISKDASLQKYLNQIIIETKKLEKLEQDLTQHEKDIKTCDYNEKHKLAGNVRDYIHTNSFSEAHTTLDELRKLVEQENIIIKDLTRISSEMASSISHIRINEGKIIIT